MLRTQWRHLAFGVLIGLAGIAFWRFGFDAITDGADVDKGSTLGWFFVLRGERPPPDDVIVVDLAEPFDGLGQALGGRPRWEPCLNQSKGKPTPETGWPRCAIAALLDELDDQGAKQVAFDLFFDQSYEGDDELEGAIRRFGDVVMTAWCVDPAGGLGRVTFGCGPRLKVPLTRFVEAGVQAAPMLLLFREKTVTRNWSFAPSQTGLLKPPPMLPLVLLQQSVSIDTLIAVLRGAGTRPPDTVLLAGANSAQRDLGTLPEQIQALRSWMVGRDDIAAAVRAWLSDEGATEFADKRTDIEGLVNTYVSRADSYLNYYGSSGVNAITARAFLLDDATSVKGRVVFVGSTFNGRDKFPTPLSPGIVADTPGVSIAATAFANFRSSEAIHGVRDEWAMLLLLAIGLLFGTMARALRPGVAVAITVGAAAGYVMVAFVSFLSLHMLLPLFTPVGQLVSGLVFGMMLRGLQPRSRTFQGICLKTDIKDSTIISRRPNFRAEIKSYFKEVRRIVTARAGIVVHAGDDSSMSYWEEGWSTTRARKAACLAALEIVQRLGPRSDLNRGRYPTRAGLHRGKVELVGGLAAGQTEVANVEGLVPSTAARIESLCKLLGTWNLASSEMVEGIDGLLFRRMGRFQMVGLEGPLEIVELVCETKRASGDLLAAQREFNSAITEMESGVRSQAETMFSAYANKHARDAAPAFFLSVLRDEIPDLARIDAPGVIRVVVK